MSQEYSTFVLFQALSIAQNTKVNAVRKIESSADIQLDYCIPKKFAKRRTDVSGADTETEAAPDTGPAGAFVELKITINRQAAKLQETLITLLKWYALRNTNSVFKRGFLGLENADNDSLDFNPVALTGYKLIDFAIVNPVDFKGTQEYIITIQLVGDVTALPAVP